MSNELIHASAGTVLTQAEFEAVGLHVLNSQATGDLIYASSTTQLTRLGIGSTNAVLVVSGGIPSWSATLAGLTLTSPTINGTIATTGLTLPAVTLGGTLTLNGQVFDAGSGGLQINTTGGWPSLVMQSTQDGAGGPAFIGSVVSASPTTYDTLVRLTGRGMNSTPAAFDYGYIAIQIMNPAAGSEDARIEFALYNAGANNSAMTLSGAGALWTDLSVDTLTYKVSGTQVVGARVVDARCDDALNSGDATTDGVIDALRDALITHGLIAAA